MQSGDQVICAFPAPQSVGETFTQWPLHVTIVPWFKVITDQENFTSLLQSQIMEIPPFGAKVRHESRFGFRRANVLLKNQWQPIHDAALACVSQAAQSRARFRFVGKLFMPHITHQGDTYMKEGDIFWCDKVYIVEQKGDYKEVIAAVELKNDNEV